MKVAVVFLCKIFPTGLPNFLTQKGAVYDSFYLLDTQSIIVSNTIHFNYVPIVILNETCVKNGYKNSSYSKGLTHIQNPIIALDRALYYFCKTSHGNEYDFVWFIEDDCFIPSIEALENLVIKYSEFDLVTSSHKKKIGTSKEWHWKKAFEVFEQPLFSSMSCCFGLSRKMLNLTRQHVQKHGELFFLEIMFNTIAAQNNLKIYTPPELSTICSKADWSLDDVLTLPNNIFHPYKDFKNAQKLRELISYAKKIDYVAVDKLPNFLTQKIEE